MKKLMFLVASIAALSSCSTDTTQDVAPSVVPGELHVSIADEESRMQLSDEKTVWTAGDKVSVFYKSDANQCWKFNGNTGDRSGTLSCVSQGTATAQMEKVVIVYPYSEFYKITPSTGNIEAKLPAVQKYLQGSYGLASSPMISSGYYTQFALKNVCGWLKLQFSGTGTVTKITLKGNNGEQLAGDMYIDAENATVTLASASVDDDSNQETGGTLVFEDSIVKEIELDCTGGVDLSASNVTPFYIALPPVVFEKGFTATLHFDNGTKHNIATSKRVEITRNHIVPMETSEITVPEYDYIDIKYVTSNKRIIDNSAKNSSWWSKVVSNTYDVENNVGTLVLPKGSSIGDYAFQDVTGLLSIEIPDNMKGSIGSYAFDGCTALKSITMSKNTSYIYSYAFRNCKNLVADMVIPNGQRTIGQYTFSGCSKLTSITIPDSVISIEGYAFQGCSSLTSITIPDSVTSIGVWAFHGCSSLTSITIPDSVTEIGGHAFDGCSSLTSVAIPDSVTSIGNDAFCGCSSLTGVYITDIAKWCAIDFSYDANPLCDAHNLYLNGELVTDLVIPDNVTSIGGYAFEGCSSLTSITIPDSVTSIGDSAFSDCSSLTSITIPDSVISIEDYAFNRCSSLTSITIPDSVTEIGGHAFDGCSSLTSVAIPDSVTSIGSCAFQGCSSLTSVAIPDSVTSIGGCAFAYCSSLTSVAIPDSVTSIGDCAFLGCSSLTGVYITDIAKWCAFDFSSNSANPLDYAHNLYLNGELVTDLVIPDGVTSIGDYAFYGCSSLRSIDIPDGVTSIGDYAFSGCSSLTSVTIPDSVTSIGGYAFSDCSSLTAFYGKYASEDNRCLIMDEQLIAFAPAGLTEYTIPNSVTSIGRTAFAYCSSLTSVTIPDSVTSIKGYAFHDCRSLTSIYCEPTTPPTMGSYVFNNISLSAKIYVPMASVAAYKTANVWSEYADKIVGYDFN